MKNLIMFLIVFLLFSCVNSEEPKLEPLTVDEISGERLWTRITEDSDYKNYSQWAGHGGLRPGQSPHGVFHEVYVNKDIFQAVPVKTAGTEELPQVPSGSIIVKENFDSAKKLDKLTVMAKVDGYSPDTNDWFWASFSPEGKVLAEGSPVGCLSCHGGRISNDYIIIKNIDEP